MYVLQTLFFVSMVKFVALKKQSKPTSSTSNINNNCPTIPSSNYRSIFQGHNNYDEEIKLMIHYLINHLLNGPFDAVCDVVREYVLFKCLFSALKPQEDPKRIHLKFINDSTSPLTKAEFLDAINLSVPA